MTRKKYIWIRNIKVIIFQITFICGLNYFTLDFLITIFIYLDVSKSIICFDELSDVVVNDVATF